METLQHIISQELGSLLESYGSPAVNFANDQLSFGLNIWEWYEHQRQTGANHFSIADEAARTWWNKNIKPSRIAQIENAFDQDGKEYLYSGEAVEHTITGLTGGKIKNLDIDFYTAENMRPTTKRQDTPEVRADLAARFPVAIRHGNSIAFYWKINTPQVANVALVRGVLSQALPKIFKVLKVPAQPPRDWQEQKIVKLYTSFRSEYIQQSKRELENSERETEDYGKLLTSAIRRTDELRKVVELTGGVTAELKAHAQAQFKAILDHPKVERADVNGETLELTMQNLTMRYAGLAFVLPRYKCSVNLKTGQLTISCADEWPDSYNYIHPHVSKGSPCLGNFDKVFRKIVATGELIQVVDLLIEYLQTYNADSPLKNIYSWYHVAKERQAKKLPEGSYDEDGADGDKAYVEFFDYVQEHLRGEKPDPKPFLATYIKVDERTKA